MINIDDLAPPKRLAIVSSRKNIRSIFSILLVFDARLAAILTNQSEAVIGQMKMAWWRDVINKPIYDRPKGEPLILELNKVQETSDVKSLLSSMTQILDAWDLLLANEEWDAQILRQHAEYRSQAIFGECQNIGTKWAMHDLALQSGKDAIDGDLDNIIDAIDDDESIPRKSRHLTLLAMSAKQEYNGGGPLSGLRLMFHGLTGL